MTWIHIMKSERKGVEGRLKNHGQRIFTHESNQKRQGFWSTFPKQQCPRGRWPPDLNVQLRYTHTGIHMNTCSYMHKHEYAFTGTVSYSTGTGIGFNPSSLQWPFMERHLPSRASDPGPGPRHRGMGWETQKSSWQVSWKMKDGEQEQKFSISRWQLRVK